MTENTEVTLRDDDHGHFGHSVSFGEAFRVWFQVALLSFGGPAGQIAMMHRILVEEKRWVSENRFLHALNYCMLLPGPEAQQLAIYIGWLLHRTAGGLMAGLLFILPGFVSILALSVLYAGYNEMTFVQGIFYGLKPAVVAIVAEALIRIGSRSLRNRTMVTLAVAAFVAIFFFQVSFPLIILAAAAIGFIGGKFRPDIFGLANGPAAKNEAGDNRTISDNRAVSEREAISDDPTGADQPRLGHSIRVLAVWLPLWLAPILALWIFTGKESVYTQQTIFFSKTAVVTFGGAYSVLAYIAQEAVNTHHWLAPGEMLDGLGMAETTPGPLIQVVQFVGFMGAWRNPGSFDPLTAGILGSIITTWVTFVPCFLWIFLGAPYIEYLRGHRSLNAALSTITATVVGVMLNLSIWFALHTLFGTVNERHWLGARWFVPDLQTLDLAALIIAVGAFFALFVFKRGMIITLAVSAVLGLLYYILFLNNGT